ncbi:transport and Golgi organization protein 6 isoform X2 [Eurosta solidaginis]|uniref:transport and Golgi organization protein 6 isoform X2 n=1 Tax=Eurosta solidaginis TaxID=178769 RepID=UPI0035306306
MSNSNFSKYFMVLENLKYLEDDGSSEADSHERQICNTKQSLEHNIAELKKYIPEEINVVTKKTMRILNPSWLQNELHSDVLTLSDTNLELTYAVYLQYMLLELAKNFNFNSAAKEDLISTRHLTQLIKAVQNLSVYALRRRLHNKFYESSVFTGANEGTKLNDCDFKYKLLLLSIEIFERFFKIQQLHIANAMEMVMRDYMAAIFSVRLANALKMCTLQELTLKGLQKKLNYLWLHVSKVDYLRNILLLKSIQNVPTEQQIQLHQELLQKVLSKDGFTTLVATLYIAHSSPQKNIDASTTAKPQLLNDKEVFEVIANIVAFHGHTQRAQSTLMRQIFEFLKTCLLNENAMIDCMGAGLLSLRRLYDLSEVNRCEIIDVIANKFSTLSRPKDILSGLIVLEHKELSLLIATIYQLFCSSTVECLPSELLIPYQPLLLQTYHHLLEGYIQKQQIASIITRCLHNRTDAELEEIIAKLYKQDFDSHWQQLHPRVIIFPNVEQTQLTVKIANSDMKDEFSASLALPELLMNSDHHQLTYRIFMILLKEMSNILNDDANEQKEAQIELLQSEEEFLTFLNSKYHIKVDILLSLNTLISHQQLKTQIGEHSLDFLRFLRTLLQQRLDVHVKANAFRQQTEALDQTLLILLTITQELLQQNEQIPLTYQHLAPALQVLQKQTPNLLIQERAKCLLTLLSGEFKAKAAQKSNAFNTARTLVESKESHLQVYGIQMLRDLLRQRDSVTLANAHLLIALALSTLKNRESYTFLNCVRLFVGLVHVMESEVLETLSDEYLNDQAILDYRLVVGETMLQVGRELGPLCYKYKDVLLNCFMHGARSPLNEFRMSSFSNLAQLTRILCYQVHKFFQELLNLIDCELNIGTYLPAQRAATFVLSELLEGIDNLLDFEEMLLPIYRLLKKIEADEKADIKVRQHAANGLKTLMQKCKKFLFPATQLQKEIRILGLNDTYENRGL